MARRESYYKVEQEQPYDVKIYAVDDIEKTGNFTVKTIVPAINRDAGKVYKIIEMSAFDFESWLIKVLLALLNAGADFPHELIERINNNEVNGHDLANIDIIKSMRGLLWHVVDPLLKDMEKCIKVCVPNVPIPRDLDRDFDVEEVKTIVELRSRVMSLHLNFSQAADTQNTAI